MSIFAEKRDGKLTGNLIVEVRVDGQTLKRRVKTAKEAKKLEAQLKAGIVTQALSASKKRLTMGDLSKEARPLWRGHKDEKNSVRKLERIIEFIGKDVLLKDLTTAHMDKLQEDLRAVGLKDATLNRYSATMSKVIQWALERGYVEKEPKLQWFKEHHTKFAWLKPEDETRLLAWLQKPENVKGDLGQRMALVVRVLVITGLRVGELLRLEADHIDPKAQTVTAWDTKTGDSRTQHLPKALCERLQHYKAVGTFPQYHSIRRTLERAKEALKLDIDLTIHSFRHTTATRLVMGGVNHRVVMDYMGHKSVATTNRYAHVNAETKRNAAQVLLGGIGEEVNVG